MRSPVAIAPLPTVMLLVALGASNGCVATTIDLWRGVASTGRVESLSLAEGADGARLVIHAEGDRWLLPLGARGEPPRELNLSEWGARSLDDLRADPRARALLTVEPDEAARRTWAKLVRASNATLGKCTLTPLRAPVFRIGNRAVIAFYDAARGDDREGWLPANAVLLPERLPRSGRNRTARTARAIALTPVALGMDAIGSVVFVPAAVALNPRYAVNMIVWVNTDGGEFPPPMLFSNQEGR